MGKSGLLLHLSLTLLASGVICDSERFKDSAPLHKGAVGKCETGDVDGSSTQSRIDFDGYVGSVDHGKRDGHSVLPADSGVYEDNPSGTGYNVHGLPYPGWISPMHRRQIENRPRCQHGKQVGGNRKESDEHNKNYPKHIHNNKRHFRVDRRFCHSVSAYHHCVHGHNN